MTSQVKSSSKLSFFVSFSLSLIALIAVVAWLHQGLTIDRTISDFFYRNHQWLWPTSNKHLNFWLHDFVRKSFVLLGILCLGLIISGFFFSFGRAYRYHLLAVLLALILVHQTVDRMKSYTHHYCPDQLQSYGGPVPDNYRNHLAEARQIKKPACFPAGHTAAGFSLLILGVLGTTRRRRIAGYAIGLGAGAALSIIQIGRGEHYFSHCLATAAIALWIVHMLPPLLKGLNCMYESYFQRKNIVGIKTSDPVARVSAIN